MSGKIAYTEFLAAIMDHKIEERRDLALAAFRGFDVDRRRHDLLGGGGAGDRGLRAATERRAAGGGRIGLRGIHEAPEIGLMHGIYDHICMAMHGNAWQCMAMHGNAWQCMAMQGAP